jgi:dTDP-4-dehydrorhamnose reductase
LTEEAKTQPINVYGSTKKAGELALEANQMLLSLEPRWVYSRFGNNFETMSRLLQKRQFECVNDQMVLQLMRLI